MAKCLFGTGDAVIIIVNHVKTMVSTDKIVVLDNGVVSGLGTPAELMKKAVARMILLQQGTSFLKKYNRENLRKSIKGERKQLLKTLV